MSDVVGNPEDLFSRMAAHNVLLPPDVPPPSDNVTLSVFSNS